jgi:uncharacterized protein (TIGR00369 family)
MNDHQSCIACGSTEFNLDTLGLIFKVGQSNQVISQFLVEVRHQGYTGLLHGGIASTLVDAAMTHCLFAQGVKALTAELAVRFHHPIYVGAQVEITACLIGERRGIYRLDAQLEVAGVSCVSATGKFISPLSFAATNS